MKFGPYKLMLIGIGLLALGVIVPGSQFTGALLVAGWGLIIFGSIRRWR